MGLIGLHAFGRPLALVGAVERHHGQRPARLQQEVERHAACRRIERRGRDRRDELSRMRQVEDDAGRRAAARRQEQLHRKRRVVVAGRQRDPLDRPRGIRRTRRLDARRERRLPGSRVVAREPRTRHRRPASWPHSRRPARGRADAALRSSAQPAPAACSGIRWWRNDRPAVPRRAAGTGTAARRRRRPRPSGPATPASTAIRARCRPCRRCHAARRCRTGRRARVPGPRNCCRARWPMKPIPRTRRSIRRRGTSERPSATPCRGIDSTPPPRTS